MILFVQNLCSATREVLKCTRRYSSSFEDDLRGLVKLGFRSPLDMLPGRATNGGASQQRAAIAAYHSAPHAAAATAFIYLSPRRRGANEAPIEIR